jgi:glycerophosphoryl diester phosphodiesterase
VVAHRGSSARHPGNGWPAFRAAQEDRADAIECDVLATRDGALAIRHDLLLDRRPVAELTRAELEAREPGIPLLPELLAWAAQAPIDLLVELKDPDAAEAAGAAIAASGWADHVVVGGFHAGALARVKARYPGLATSLMVGTVVGPGDLIALARGCGADGVHPCWEARAPRPHRLLDRAAVRRLHEAGLSVTLWHEEREDELEILAALGADAICTNTPDRLRAILDRRPATAPRPATGAAARTTTTGGNEP